jgi:divalent metal cation (Fe/Co/Zn/Cd) transporter
VIFEAISFFIAYRQFQAVKGQHSIWQAIRASKDPTTFTVLFEDSAAMLGLIAAAVGIFLGHRFENPYFDGAASIVIGLILAAVALFIGYESKGLLVGEGADFATLQSIKSIAQADPKIAKVERPLTMYFGPHTVLLTMDVQFRNDLSGADRDLTVKRLEQTIRKKHPDINHIFIESKSRSARAEPRQQSDESAAG